MNASLPVAPSWYRSEPSVAGVTRIDEPHVHEFLRSNIWHIKGSRRDLVVDAGLGVTSLRRELPHLFSNHPLLIVTHAHLDHAGAAHEFADRWSHPSERLDVPPPASLRGPDLARLLGFDAADAPTIYLSALPTSRYQIDDFEVSPAPSTVDLADGAQIDLGDRVLSLLHLPGHTPGSCVLFDRDNGALFSGDVIYDDYLLDDLHGSDIADYRTSMEKLRELDVNVVYPGHGAPFDGVRMREIIDAYLTSRPS